MKLLEEKKEEEKLKREQEEINRKYEEEKNKEKQKLDKIAAENKNFVIEKEKKKKYIVDTPENPINVPVIDNRQNYNYKNIEQHEFNPVNQNVQDNYQYNQYVPNNFNLPLNNQANEAAAINNQVSEAAIENELLKLRTNLMDQQNELLRQINELKSDAQKQNLERYEALQEINVLKEELTKNRMDEEVRKKYVYDVIVDNNNKVNEIFTTTKLPPINDGDLHVDLMNPINKKINNQIYDDRLKYPNRIPKVPELQELYDQCLPSESRFIDVDTYKVHNVYI